MFALSYTSRCLLCRAAFVACCVMPTTGVLLYAGWLKLPGHVASYQQSLEQQLRMRVKVASVEPLQPGRVKLRDIEITDRQSNGWIVRTPQLETVRNGSMLALTANHIDLSGDCWKHLVSLLDDHAGRAATISLSASRVNWHVAEQIMQVEQFTARLQHGRTGPVCDVQFRLLGRDTEQPVHFMVERVRDEDRQLIGYEINTGDNAYIACSLALPALPWLARLGPRAEFSGQAVVYHGEEGWQGELQGQFRGVELRRLVAQPFGHEVHGLAEIRIEHARFHHSRLTQVSGTLSTGPGMIGPSLRLASIRWLQLLASRDAAQSQELLPYDELALHFAIDSSGMKIEGTCAQGPKGTVLCDRRQPLLATPPQGEQLPLANLIHAIAPASDALVPASRQAGWLLEILPTP